MAAIALGSTATVLGLAAAVTALKLADKDAVPLVVAAPGVAPAAPAAAAPGAPPAPPGAGPPPGGLPFGWESAIDPRYGLPYYYNRTTKETTWRPPPGEPNPFAGNPFASKQGVDRKAQLDAAVLDAKKPKEAPPTPGPTPAPASPPAPGLPGVPPGPPGVPGVDRKAQLDAALNGDVPQPPPVPGSPPAPGLPPPVGGPAPYRPRPLGAPLGPRGSLGIPGRPVLPLGGPRPAPNVAGLPGAAPIPPGDTPVPFVPPAPNVAGLPGAAPAPGPAPGDTPVLPAPNVAAPRLEIPDLLPTPPAPAPLGGIAVPMARGQGASVLGPEEQAEARARQLRATVRAPLAPIRIPGRGNRRTRRNYALDDSEFDALSAAGNARIAAEAAAAAAAAAPPVAAVPGVISAPPPPPPEPVIDDEDAPTRAEELAADEEDAEDAEVARQQAETARLAAEAESARQLRATPRALPPGRGNRRTRRNYALDDSEFDALSAAGNARIAAEAAAAAAAAAPPVAAVPGVISAPPPPPPQYNINAEEWKPAVQHPSAADLQAQADALRVRAANIRAQADEATRNRVAADEEAARLKRLAEAGLQPPAAPNMGSVKVAAAQEPIDEAPLRAQAEAEIAASLAAVPPPTPVVIPENEVNVAPPVQAPNPLGSLREAEAAAAAQAAARNPPGDRLIASDGRDITPVEPYDPAQRRMAGLPKLSYAQKQWIVKRDPTWLGTMLGGRHKTHRRRRRRARGGMDAETRKKKIDAIATRLLLEAAKKQRAAEEAAKAAKAAVKARSNFQKEGQVKK